MAKILGQDEQQRALKEIRSLVKAIDVTNQFLAATNPDGIYRITFKADDDTTYSADLLSEDKQQIDAFINQYKEKIKEYILDLAHKNRIALDDSDNEVLGINSNEAQDQTLISPLYR